MAIKYLDAKRIQGSSVGNGMFDGSDLKAYWQFDEASTSTQNNDADVVTSNSTLGDNADLTLSGTPATEVSGTPSGIGNAVTFDGSNDYAVAGSSVSQFNFMWDSTAKFSIGFWMKVNTWAANDMILDAGCHADAANTGMQINLNGADSTSGRKLAFQITKSHATEVTYNVSAANLVEGTGWNHFVITWDYSLGSANCKFYKNGAITTNASDQGIHGVGAGGNADAPLNIGRNADSNGQLLDASLAEFFIFDRVLTSTEISNIYSSSNPLTTADVIDEKATLITTPYASGLGSSADGVNAPDGGTAIPTGTDSNIPSGLDSTTCWDASAITTRSQRIKITETTSVLPAGTGSYTIAYWFNAQNTDSNSKEIIRHDNDIEIRAINATHHLYGAAGNLTHTISADTWYWACIVNDGGTVNFYQNNVAASGGTTTPYASIVAATNNNTSWNIMGRSDEAEGFRGKVKDVAFWDRALTSAERVSIYGNGGSTAKSATDVPTNLRAYYSCNTIAPNGVDSATTESNLPENTIFEETDTQTLYWLQTIDGVTNWYPSWYDTFVKDRGWTAYNSSTNNVDTTNGLLNVISIEPFSIEIPELGTKWLCDIDVYWDSVGSNQEYVFFTNYNATKYNVSTGTPQYIGLRGCNSGETLRITNYEGGETNDGDQYMSPAASSDTWYYYRIIRNGDDATLIKYATEDNRRDGVSAIDTEVYSNFVGAVSWDEDIKIKYIAVGGYSSANFDVKNIRIYNGVTSI